MAKQCDDFEYIGKTLSSLGYVCVDFESKSEIPLSLSREINKGETNTYRKVANHYGVKYTDVLPLSFNIVKNPYDGNSQSEMIISEDDIREVTRWLTSSALPQWLTVTTKNNSVRYKGLFTDITTFVVGCDVLGLEILFTCDSPYAYTGDIITSKDVAGYDTLTIENNSDELEDYVYPTISIDSVVTGSVFIHNLTDSMEFESGTLSNEENSYLTSLTNKVTEYAKMHGYEVEFRESNTNIVPIINNTCLQFDYIDKFGTVTQCVAYFDDKYNYSIFSGGFMYMNVLSNNPIIINCEKYQIYDYIQREILLSDIGLEDVGEMYWMRYLSGENNIRVFANNATITFRHKEERKIGAI